MNGWIRSGRRVSSPALKRGKRREDQKKDSLGVRNKTMKEEMLKIVNMQFVTRNTLQNTTPLLSRGRDFTAGKFLKV